MSEEYGRGAVLWAPDPFRAGSNPRPWLVLTATLPYPGEEYICVALTTSNLPDNHEIGDEWMRGRNPNRTSYCSPWVLGTVKHSAVTNKQGEVTSSFTEQMTEKARAFLSS